MAASTDVKGPPFHVLMSGAQQQARQKPWLFDSRLQRDYIAKRCKVYKEYQLQSASGGGRDTQSTSNNEASSLLSSLWEGVSPLEQSLAACCKHLEEEDEDESTGWLATEEADHKARRISTAGALDMTNEIRFVGILARDCHTVSSKCLALAILERTVSLHLLEEAGEDSNDDERESPSSDEDMEAVHSDDEADDDWKANAPSDQSLRSRRAKRRRQEEKTKDDPEHSATETSKIDQQAEYGRLERFLAAGGLKILNEWLEDALEDDIIAIKPGNLSPTNNKSVAPPKMNQRRQRTAVTANNKEAAQSVGIQPSPRRPLILPILKLLENFPSFDKAAVVESKINKQIKLIGKQVDRILESKVQGNHQKEDLENWTMTKSGTATEALEEVSSTVEAIKIKWQEKAKEKKEKLPDPFFSLISQLKERTDLLQQYESNSTEKPEWYTPNEVEQGSTVKKGKAAKAKSLHTQQLAARERNAERTALQKRLKDAQIEHRERLEKLRERMRQAKEREDKEPEVLKVPSTNGKKVSWKDGLKSSYKNRSLLEDVCVFSQRDDTVVVVDDDSQAFETYDGEDPAIL